MLMQTNVDKKNLEMYRFKKVSRFAMLMQQILVKKFQYCIDSRKCLDLYADATNLGKKISTTIQIQESVLICMLMATNLGKKIYFCVDSRKCQDLYTDATILR